RWRSAAKQYISATWKDGGKIDGCVSTIVSRRGIELFEGRILFLVADHEAEIAERKEHGRAGAEHNLQVTVLHLRPDLDALILGETRMIDANVSAEMLLQPANHLSCQCDFREEVQNLPAFSDYLLD